MHLNTSYLRGLALVCVTASFALTALAAPPGMNSKAPEYSSQPFNRAAAIEQRDELHQWLMSGTVLNGLDHPVVAVFTGDELAAVDNARGEDPMRVGLTRSLSVNVSFADLKISRLNGRTIQRGNGAITATEDGGFVYTMALSSPGAAALRVHFTGFRLPPATGVYLYTDETQAFGPYTGRGPLGDGEFWSNTVVGDYVILQLRHVGPATDADLHGAGFTVAGLGHVRPVFLAGTCSNNASCTVNAECVNNTAVDPARDAVAAMQWISGAFIYFCSGGLVADTDDSTKIPYFLTANHCISKGKDARNLENFFQFTKPCDSTSACLTWQQLRDTWTQDLRTLGASIVSTGRGGDYTLLQLAEPAPDGSAFLGWDSTPVAFNNGTHLYRISHPGGAPQSYSAHTVDLSAPTCQSWPRGERIYSHDVYGATEGGSSGSPVVNGNGEIVGQLSGACGTNVNDVCDSAHNATVDGAFAYYFSQVSSYLDNGGGGCTATETTETSCNDGVDNDCDGLIDNADSDCSSGGGGLPPGAHCMVDSDCASNSCSKGKPSTRVCN